MFTKSRNHGRVVSTALPIAGSRRRSPNSSPAQAGSAAKCISCAISATTVRARSARPSFNRRASRTPARAAAVSIRYRPVQHRPSSGAGRDRAWFLREIIPKLDDVPLSAIGGSLASRSRAARATVPASAYRIHAIGGRCSRLSRGVSGLGPNAPRYLLVRLDTHTSLRPSCDRPFGVLPLLRSARATVASYACLWKRCANSRTRGYGLFYDAGSAR